MEPVLSNEGFLKWIALAILGGFVGMLQWAASRLHRRVDELERYKASTSEVQALVVDFKEHREETRDSLKEINSNILQLVRDRK